MEDEPLYTYIAAIIKQPSIQMIQSTRIYDLPCISNLSKVKELLVRIRNQKRSQELPEHDRTFDVHEDLFPHSHKKSDNEEIIARSKDMIRILDSLRREPTEITQTAVEPAVVQDGLQSLRCEIDQLVYENESIAMGNIQLEQVLFALTNQLFHHREQLREQARQEHKLQLLKQNNQIILAEIKSLQHGTERKRMIRKELMVQGKKGLEQGLKEEEWRKENVEIIEEGVMKMYKRVGKRALQEKEGFEEQALQDFQIDL